MSLTITPECATLVSRVVRASGIKLYQMGEGDAPGFDEPYWMIDVESKDRELPIMCERQYGQQRPRPGEPVLVKYGPEHLGGRQFLIEIGGRVYLQESQ